MWSLRHLMPKRSTWRVAQFDTLRLRLVKLAARVIELKTRVLLHLPSACPYQSVLRLAAGRMPRLNSRASGADAPAELHEPQPQASQSAPLRRPTGPAPVTHDHTTSARATAARPALASSLMNYPG